MSAIHTHEAWTNPRVKGAHKLALLALAANANHKGEAQVSLRHVAFMCSVSKTRINVIINDLIRDGFLRVVSTGGGKSNPSIYWIASRTKEGLRSEFENFTPDMDERNTEPGPISNTSTPETQVLEPSFVPDPVSAPAYPEKTEEFYPIAGLTIEDVAKVLRAAEVSPAPDQPFYWSRKEHVDDLQDLLTQINMDVPSLCEALQRGVEDKVQLQAPPRRIHDLAQMVVA